MRYEMIEIGPFGAFFTNVNSEMGLKGHSHSAEIKIGFKHPVGGKGFPAFADTYLAVQGRIKELTAKTFKDCTNEQVARALYKGFEGWGHPSVDIWKCDFELCELELAVRGVHDDIGHADGFTRYKIYQG